MLIMLMRLLANPQLLASGARLRTAELPSASAKTKTFPGWLVSFPPTEEAEGVVLYSERTAIRPKAAKLERPAVTE